MTKIIQTIEEWQTIRETITGDLGLVPTMGNLHVGHVSLLKRSVHENEVTVMTIFVNPTQFNNANDYVHYPRTLEHDLKIAEDAKVDYVLMPKYAELYPDDYTYQVNEQEASLQLEGAFRPGHFSGMLTVVMKLLMIAQADRAYFGEKDYQQLQLVRGMAHAFFINTEIVGCPTIRTEFGLPYSSRNSRLTPQEFELARHFPALFHSPMSCEQIKKELQAKGFEVDYVEERDGRRFAAVKIGEVRLIDNIEWKGEMVKQ